jgi:hypothetical protein
MVSIQYKCYYKVLWFKIHFENRMEEQKMKGYTGMKISGFP